MRNGYFQLVNAGEGYGVKLVPPTDGGEPIRIGELTDYLMRRNHACDIAEIKREVDKGEPTVLRLGVGNCPIENAVIQVRISEDSMSVTARVIPPSESASVFSTDDIELELKKAKVVYGIKPEVLSHCVREKLYCMELVVAQGTPPRHGHNAEIEYFFNTDLKIKPTQNDDGSVNFFQLNMINHCKEGDVLAKLTPEDLGEPGMNVFGTKIKPRDVRRETLRYGNNIQLSESRTTLTSKVNGHVTLVEGKVFVSNVFVVKNVDMSTGDIEYDGSVQVDGNVQSNFNIKAGGNIVVNGIVEAAYLEAGGDIIIARGMKGMTKGSLKAKGNIVVKFLENAKVTAQGSVNTDSIVHSEVLAGTEVIVEGKRGFIAGGHVCAGSQIKAKTLGSVMGISTVLEVGVDPVIKVRYGQVQIEMAEVAKELQAVEPIIITHLQKLKQGQHLTTQQLDYLKSLVATREVKKEKQDRLNIEMMQLQIAMEQQGVAQVVAQGDVFPGVKISIGELSTVIQSNVKYCRFVRREGEVKMSPI